MAVISRLPLAGSILAANVFPVQSGARRGRGESVGCNMSASHLAALVGLFVVVIMGAGEASCSCGSHPLADRLANADVAFIGVPEAIAAVVASASGDHEIWEFQVVGMVKGPSTEIVNVSSGGKNSNCSTSFEAGERIGILANWQAGHLVAGQCGVVDPDALATIGVLEPSTSAPSARVVVAVVGAGVGIAVLLVLRRRRGT